MARDAETPSVVPSPQRKGVLSLRLLRSFCLEVSGRAVELPHGSQRILAFLALHAHGLQRRFVAGSLWTDASDLRADANLRSAIWRIRTLRRPILLSGHGTLRLDPRVSVDVDAARAQAHRWLSGEPTPDDLAAGSSVLQAELLPDWYDEWLIDERDRFRQLRLHALDSMAQSLSDRGRHADALLAALAAATEDPLRESAQRTLIKVHLAEGNTGEAIRQLHRCEQLFQRELGLRPSRGLTDLVRRAVLTTG